VSKAEDTAHSTERRAQPPPAAQRALAEAQARRREAAQAPAPPQELGGRDGPDPARYGDWEVKGIASDF
jgi:hypothetical protein